MARHSGFKTDFERTAVILSSLLFFAYAMHLGGSINFAFDLFSHFLNQYLIGGAILGITMLCFRKWKISALCFLVAILSLVEGRAHLQAPYTFQAPKGEAPLSVMSFNHLLFQEDYPGIERWIRSHGKNLDVISLIEAQRKGTAALAQNLSDLYPHQILEPRSGSTGIIVLSKHHVTDIEKENIMGVRYELLSSIGFTIRHSKLNKNIRFYITHPPVPRNAEFWEFRNNVMHSIARKSKRYNNHVIVMGDLNNTPFTPSFRSFLEVSGLNYQSYGILQNPTWPSFFMLPIFQIPIDHVFYSDSLKQENKYVGPALKSDHYAIIAEFSENNL